MPGAGRRSVIIIGMWGEPVAAGTDMTLQQPEARCVFSGNLALDHGTLAVLGCTGSSGGGVDSDLCLHTGFLVAAAAALAFHARLWDLS